MQTNWFDLSQYNIYPSGPGSRVLTIVLMAIAAHVVVRLLRFISDWIIRNSVARRNPVRFVTSRPKFITVTSLVVGAVTFIIYFFAVGLILNELLGVNLTAYLATASVIGLAVGFGSQGLVQDVVTGLTLIFSNILHVGDLIEVSGQIGRVKRIGLRFTQLTNFFNQQVFVPNRMIANIARFPAGGVHAYVDVQIPAQAEQQKALEMVNRIAKGMWTQFPAIILSEPAFSEVEIAEAGTWNFVRVQFVIWPGQGMLLETTFRQRLTGAMKTLEPNYADWMVAITYRARALTREADEFVI